MKLEDDMTDVDKNLPWGIHTIRDICGSPNVSAGLPDGRWVRAVPSPHDGNRLVAAWWVLVGRANAIIWPSSTDLANATGAPIRKRPRADDWEYRLFNLSDGEVMETLGRKGVEGWEAFDLQNYALNGKPMVRVYCKRKI